MWVYEQRSGRLWRNGALVATGYSGFGECKNRPEDQHRPGLGPIPQGAYWIGAAEDSESKGPVVMALLPVTPGTETFGRSGFLVHGDSREHPGLASHGCIVVARPAREVMANSGDRLLAVIP